MTAPALHIAITGATGLVGTALCAHLAGCGHQVTAVTRRPGIPDTVYWDPAAGILDPNALSGVDAVVHLAGEPIAARRWTTAQKRRIRDSRVNGTRLLADAIASAPDGPRVLVSGSAIDYYPDGDEPRTETSAPATDFLGTVCQQWEAATEHAATAGVRVVHLRTGHVQSPAGGALARMLPVFRAGLGGRFGSGQQWWSWISITDHVGIVTHALTHEQVTGPVNATAPNPVTNAEFTATLGKVLRRPAMFRIPRVAPSLLFGRELVNNLLYAGPRVIPSAIQGFGYEFAHADLETALRAELGR